MIDLPPITPLADVLNLTTCSAYSDSLTATIAVGHGCPSAAYGLPDRFTCIGGASENVCGKGALVSVAVTTSRRLYVLINGRDQTLNPITTFQLNYSYVPPTTSPSTTCSTTATSTQTSTTSAATSAPSQSPSLTATPVLPCEQRVQLASSLSGLSNSTGTVSLTDATPVLGFDPDGDCGQYVWARSDWRSAIVMIDLPPSALLGGNITLTTCSAFADTYTATIAVGHGCPSTAYGLPDRFTCIGGAGENACGKGALVSVTVAASRRLFVLINGRDQTFNPITTFVLNYSYVPPSPSTTCSTTSTSTQTPSATATTCSSTQTPSPTTTPVLPCEQRIPLASRLSGLSNSTGTVLLTETTPLLGFDPDGDCGQYVWARSDWRSAIVMIDLPPSALPGGNITLSTCSAYSGAYTATIAVGHWCPLAAYALADRFTCIGGASENACGKGAIVNVAVTTSRRLYVLINGRNQTLNPISTFVLNYSYTQLTPSPSRTQSVSPPVSPSASSSASQSPSTSSAGSQSQTRTQSPSQSATPSGSQTPTASASRSASGTGSRSSTPSRSRSLPPTRSPTRSSTPTPTPSRTATRMPPLCRAPVSNVTLLGGVSGSTSPLSTASSAGNAGLYTSGSCAAGLKTFWPGPRLVLYLDLGPGTPLGGALTVTTCGLTSNNTVLYVGTGCPTWAVPFACLAGNDDAGDDGVPPPAACAGNARASALTLPALRSRALFVQVAGYGGTDVAAGLAWAYRPPSASPTPSRSRTATGSRTRSGASTRSRSRKPKL